MLTQDQKLERNIILNSMEFEQVINPNSALLRQLKSITESACKEKGKASFSPVDEGKSIFWNN